MELLFNLSWVALSCALVLMWFASPQRPQSQPGQSTTRMQIVALALLIVVLLPVVSLTDDLQACTAPVESEHIGRRVDLLPAPTGAAEHALMIVTRLLTFHKAAHLQTLAAVSPALQVEKPCAGYMRLVGSRPPPAA